ncbi:hypothetical protein FNH22_16350 [Fulvivirga sp. M361]|uniref:NAD(P)-dependent oxidoreductase n=1 Tax=Fulvivirga sp. M361 TaxID=2594266 RepID=UPI00117A512B|nr:NAD(P)H-binding protein [Fulvivirga sp. M361]TRX56209.1 hypothetical protein FNH22_16350 [Fulvivirga sp. M361]
MMILLLGGTGRTGKLVLEEAVKRGYLVNCLVRDPTRLERDHASINFFKGSPNQMSDLKQSMYGCEAIISVLNISRTPDFPWARLRTPVTFLSDVMHNVIELAEQEGIKRIIVCSAWGVAETKRDVPAWFNWFINNSNIGFAYKDHEKQEELLKKSNLRWTIVRPTGLTNSKKEQKVIESYYGRPGRK